MPYKNPIDRRNYAREWSKISRRENLLPAMLNIIKRRAKAAGIPYNLDLKWAKKMYTGYCELTGLKFVPGINRKSNSYSPSVDRIIPQKGYTKKNCRVILLGVNALKSSGTDADMYKIAEALIEKRKLNDKISSSN